MVLHGKTGGVVITCRGIPTCNGLTRRLRNGRWAASAWRWGRRWGPAAAVRAFDRHGDARIGDGDAIRSIGINSQHHFTECDGGGQVGLRRSCDGKFLRLAETAGKAEVRWRNLYRNPGVIAVPDAVQLVASVRVLRTVRVQVQLGVQSMLRADGMFKVLGSPPVLGFASR